ncbi:hypothetical protein SAMN04488499_107728, partial [Sporomusa acidovorans]
EQLDSIPGVDTLAAQTVIAEISPVPHNYFSTSITKKVQPDLSFQGL